MHSKEHPNSPQYLRQLAIFLRDMKDDFEEAESLFQIADELEEHTKNPHKEPKLCC